MAAVESCELERALRGAVEYALHSGFSEIEAIKPVQEEALLHFIKREDVFTVLPTGCGKSLIFQLVPKVCTYLHDRGFNYPKAAILVVICPLKALIDSHIQELKDHGISACSLADEYLLEDDVPKHSIVFTSPELIVREEKWRNVLQSKAFQERLFGLVTDEAHVVPKWGKGNEKSKRAAFRECFFRIGDVRSLLPQGTPILALTATATEEIVRDTLKGLAMKADTHHISVSPDRPNIYLYKVKVNKDLMHAFAWLIDTIKKEANETARTIIYCKSQKDCGKLFKHFKFELGSFAYYPPGSSKEAKHMLIGMYHAKTLEQYKERVSESLFDREGICRVVFASTALGMGVNLRDVHQVIHYGPPRQIEDFVQEIGRAGRDGKPAKSLLFYTGVHLKKCEQIVKDYARSEKVCLRKLLLDKFGATASETNEPHNCCCICHLNCNCTGNSCNIELPSFVQAESNAATFRQREKRNVEPYQKEELQELLQDYKEKLDKKCMGYVLSSESTTGFSSTLIKSLLKTCKYIFSLDDVIDLNPVFTKQHALDILHMVRDVFEDFELDMSHTLNSDDNLFFLDNDFEYGGIYEEDSSGTSGDEGSITSSASELSGVMDLG